MLFAADEGILHVPDNDEATNRRMKAKLINEKRYTCWIPSSRACRRDGHINNGI
jgi:hypothetical protein